MRNYLFKIVIAPFLLSRYRSTRMLNSSRPLNKRRCSLASFYPLTTALERLFWAAGYEWCNFLNIVLCSGEHCQLEPPCCGQREEGFASLSIGCIIFSVGNFLYVRSRCCKCFAIEWRCSLQCHEDSLLQPCLHLRKVFNEHNED